MIEKPPNTNVMESACELLFREARYLDDGEWEAWAELYETDAVFWVPAWLSEHELVTNPNTNVSFIYHDSRAQLLERINRLKSRKAISALPLPRTVHLISNVIASPQGELVHVRSNWTTHIYDPREKKQNLLFGIYEHDLKWAEGRLRILKKKIVIKNDRVFSLLDFFCI